MKKLRVLLVIVVLLGNLNNSLLPVLDEKLWSESPRTSQSCIHIETDSQYLEKYIRKRLEITQKIWEKGRIQSHF